MTRTTYRIGLLIIAALAASPLFAWDKNTWKQPLADKAAITDKNIRERHNILGLYPSNVQIPPKGMPMDITTATPFSDVAHAVCWTSNHLAGSSYRYAYLKKIGASPEELADAKARADQLFEAVYRCQLVTGEVGLQARGYFLGHGDTYEERAGSKKSDDWHQGNVDGQDLRFRTDPSHHNYSDAIHGLGQYYDLAAEGDQKDRCRQAIFNLVSYWVDNDYRILDYHHQPGETAGTSILGITDGKTLNTRIMMAIAGAKVAHHATGDEKFKRVYDQLTKQYGVREIKEFKTEKDFDDAEHVFCHLENLFRIETDPELLAGYRVVLDGLWANHRNDAQSLFTYIYMGLTPNAPDRDKALKDALFSLQTWPTDMTLRPTMNSIFPDRKPPYPVYQAAWDNEYMWKGSLLKADGWLSRRITDVAVSAQDPMILYACEENGSIYQSRDGAATPENWRPVDATLNVPAKAIDVGAKSRVVAAACVDGFYLTTTAGTKWAKLPVPADTGAPVDIQFDPTNGNVLYAVTERAAYRSADFGELFVGKTWELLTAGLPETAGPRTIILGMGNPGRIYVVIGDSLFTRTFAETTWTQGANLNFPEYTELYPWFVVDPANCDHALCTLKARLGDVTISMFRQTMDGGKSWSPDLPEVYAALEHGMEGLASLVLFGEVGKPVFSAKGDMIFTGSERGVRRSADGGKTWTESKEGLDIPVPQAIFAQRGAGTVYVGTPAGLFMSKDGGDRWETANLVLQFEKNTQRELGDASYLDAYWRAKYYGFIDDVTDKAPWRD